MYYVKFFFSKNFVFDAILLIFMFIIFRWNLKLFYIFFIHNYPVEFFESILNNKKKIAEHIFYKFVREIILDYAWSSFLLSWKFKILKIIILLFNLKLKSLEKKLSKRNDILLFYMQFGQIFLYYEIHI